MINIKKEENTKKEINNNINSSKDVSILKPKPIASCNYFEFNDLKKGDIKNCLFILRNIGGPYEKINIDVINIDVINVESKVNIESKDVNEKKQVSFLKLTKLEPLEKNQIDRLPLKVFFQVKALDWSKKYEAKIVARLDDIPEEVVVKLDTQTKPVNDFAKIFSIKEIKKINQLINKIEKITSAEVALVTLDSIQDIKFQNDDISKINIDNIANKLFNEWGIGKKDKNNGILFLIDITNKIFRFEVGLGLENIITSEFISNTSNKYIIPNFKNGKYAKGAYLALTDIFAEIFRSGKN